MRKTNCPNCGAPINSIECSYCGTVFYDFATLNSEKPTYLRMNWYNKIITVKAVMRSASISFEYNEFPDINIEFMAVPDDDGVIIKQEERDDRFNKQTGTMRLCIKPERQKCHTE